MEATKGVFRVITSTCLATLQAMTYALTIVKLTYEIARLWQRDHDYDKQ